MPSLVSLHTANHETTQEQVQQHGSHEAPEEDGHEGDQEESDVLMAARYYSQFKERKVSAKGKRPSESAGSTPAIKVKPAFPGAHVPGKTGRGYPSLGAKKCPIYPKSEGL